MKNLIQHHIRPHLTKNKTNTMVIMEHITMVYLTHVTDPEYYCHEMTVTAEATDQLIH
jgi:hypothetical protein